MIKKIMIVSVLCIALLLMGCAGESDVVEGNPFEQVLKETGPDGSGDLAGQAIGWGAAPLTLNELANGVPFVVGNYFRWTTELSGPILIDDGFASVSTEWAYVSYLSPNGQWAYHFNDANNYYSFTDAQLQSWGYNIELNLIPGEQYYAYFPSTSSINPAIWFYVPGGTGGTAGTGNTNPVPGCTDSGAYNYDPAATQDDGSCLKCGDGIVNGPTGVEQCDDANSDPQDGCSQCQFVCYDSDGGQDLEVYGEATGLLYSNIVTVQDLCVNTTHTNESFCTAGTNVSINTTSCNYGCSLLNNNCRVGPVSTCTDGVQNGDETGVDCGGHCNGC